jgi:NAD(P)-dependent dehydrogenase (short-subunit alcohol dehydrogenase family)
MSGALEEATSVDSMRLDGKVAVVTGGARGIGQAIACTLSQTGATIVVGDVRDPATALERIRAPLTL